MTVPSNCRYTPDHIWVRLKGEIATIGITDHAQEELSDVVFVELPDHGDVEKASPVAVVESVKAASDLYAPVSGEIIEINIDLVTDPTKVNHDPYDTGWIYKMRVDSSAESQALLDASSYSQLIS